MSAPPSYERGPAISYRHGYVDGGEAGEYDALWEPALAHVRILEARQDANRSRELLPLNTTREYAAYAYGWARGYRAETR